jgi:hypothetical protein
MGHSSIKLTADIYGHLIPGADISWIDKAGFKRAPKRTQDAPAGPGRNGCGKRRSATY